MSARRSKPPVITLTLNATVDRVLSVPGFRPGGVLRAELKELIPAGKGFNVSRVLAELGMPTIAVGLVGESEADLYASSFRGLGVETLLYGYPRPTRSNITIVDPESGVETHLRDRGPRVPKSALDRMESEIFLLAPEDGPIEALPVGVFAFCGSLPPGLTPKRLVETLESARRFGHRLFVDSSGAALRAAWELRPEVLSVNAEELGELAGRAVGRPSQALSTARSLLTAAGARSSSRSPVILVKLGAEGALAVTGSEAWRAHPPVVEARNTVGAGDAFNAGYLARESAGVPEALGFAAACGAAQAASPALGRLRLAQIERLAGQVRVESL